MNILLPRRFPLICFSLTSSALLSFLLPNTSLAESRPGIKIIEPKQTNSPKRSATIDSERYQIGLFTGFLSVEDFSTNAVTGLSGFYRINDTYMVGFEYGTSNAGLTTFEKRDDIVFLTEKDRDWNYQSLKGAYKLFSARSFFSPKAKYDSDIYLTGGIESVEFAKNKKTGFSLGASYRVVATDWLVLNVDLTDHIAKTTSVFQPADASGKLVTHTTHNVSFTFGVNALF